MSSALPKSRPHIKLPDMNRPQITELDIIRPDDWHVHFRDGSMLKAVVPETARHFARALVMPNLIPPVVTAKQAHAYREEILAAIPSGNGFYPHMTLYLTEATAVSDLQPDLITAVKLYPAGATTNSESGVRQIEAVMPILEKMADIGLPLCIHGEVTDPDVDIFDREAEFITRCLAPLHDRLPELRLILEHVTTKDGIDFVRSCGAGVAATLTVHHLFINRTDIFAGGIRPHYFCLPVAKREQHRLALRAAATSGDRKFFLGTDSAPHTNGAKESACGCAGCFTATYAMPLLAQAFEDEGALDQLEGFASRYGAEFYGLPFNTERLRLVRQDTPLKLHHALEINTEPQRAHVTQFDPKTPIYWSVKDPNQT